MTDKEMLQKLLSYGLNMRAYQKAYFRESDKSKKKELLGKSKTAEIEFDNALFNINQLIK